MSFKSLLVPVQAGPVCQRALPRVAAFAERLGADLTGVAARAPVFLADPWIMTGDLVQRLADEDEAQLKAAEARFHEATKGLGGRAHWVARRDFPNTAVAIEAAGADLIVATLEKGPEASTVGVSTLILEAGLPVLVLPDHAPEIGTRRIAVAWRNTADARRAVSVAMPLLERAEAVSVLQVVRGEDAEDAWTGLKALTDRLRRNGVKADADLIVNDINADSSALIAAAQERRAEMMVIGGYGHARAREWILGGMTRDLLDLRPLPLFMVH